MKSTITSGFLNFPVLLRYRPIKFLNLGAGAYYSRIVSSWSVSASGYDSTSVNYGDNDFGFVVAAGARIPVGQALRLVADLRYAHSLTDVARGSNESLNLSDIRCYAGVSYVF